MARTYRHGRLRTEQVARAVGVHPSTVRLYENLGFLPPIPRAANGYRLYDRSHIEQMRLARLAFRGPFVHGRALVDEVVRTAARGHRAEARTLAERHLNVVLDEIQQAESAVAHLDDWARQAAQEVAADGGLRIGDVSRLLGVSADVLRNWERNGFLTVPRDPVHDYRRYGPAVVGRLRVIRLLRRSGFSQSAILRMIHRLDIGAVEGLRQALDTPRRDDDVVHATDRWLSALRDAEAGARELIRLI